MSRKEHLAAYRERLKARIERAPLDAAWAHRGPDVLAALLIMQSRLRSEIDEFGPMAVREWADALLLANAGVVR